MKESTQRISGHRRRHRVVLADGPGASIQRIELTDGIDSALAVLRVQKLGDDTLSRVVRDCRYGVPEIQAYPGELNQVWTSLIDNALDAMNSAGPLRLV